MKKLLLVLLLGWMIISPLHLDNKYLRSDSFAVVTIKAGDTVESVASRYAVSPEEKQELVEAICEVNDVNIDSRMNSGRKLSVPVLKTDSSMVARK